MLKGGLFGGASPQTMSIKSIVENIYVPSRGREGGETLHTMPTGTVYIIYKTPAKEHFRSREDEMRGAEEIFKERRQIVGCVLDDFEAARREIAKLEQAEAKNGAAGGTEKYVYDFYTTGVYGSVPTFAWAFVALVIHKTTDDQGRVDAVAVRGYRDQYKARDYIAEQLKLLPARWVSDGFSNTVAFDRVTGTVMYERPTPILGWKPPK